MSKGDPVTNEELIPEHKQKFDEIKALFEADLIGSFEMMSYSGSKKQNRSLHTCAQDVQITHMSTI
jgi:hypothetical protein